MFHNRHGCYSVKFGYWFINSLVRREEIREAEARPSLNELKVEVWKIPTAPKIKTFIWRAVSNAIPAGPCQYGLIDGLKEMSEERPS